MIAAVLITGAMGLTLFVLGLPPLNRLRFTHRVEPYLGGLHGRPSHLLSAGSATRSRFAESIQSFLRRAGLDGDTHLANRLAAAGLELAPADFRLQQVTWAIAGSIGALGLTIFGFVAGIDIDVRSAPIVVVLSFGSGFLARDWWLTRQVEERRATLQEQLPTAIDLVTLAIMAGESVPAAFERSVRSLGPRGIGSELARVVADIRAGAPVTEALTAMKRRLPVTGIARFTDSLCTGIEKGTPLADVLRAQADDGRESRRRLLLEAGGRREVLMLIPVVFLIMPVVVVFALYPGLVSLDLLVP